MREQRKKIETNPAQQGLNAAFAQLEIAGLPDAPEPVNSAAASGKSASAEGAARKLGRVVLRRETAHRGGKTVIVVHDFPAHLPASAIEQYAKKLRAGCGCGGTVKERTIEVQGDQPQKIRAILEQEGFTVAEVK